MGVSNRDRECIGGTGEQRTHILADARGGLTRARIAGKKVVALGRGRQRIVNGIIVASLIKNTTPTVIKSRPRGRGVAGPGAVLKAKVVDGDDVRGTDHFRDGTNRAPDGIAHTDSIKVGAGQGIEQVAGVGRTANQAALIRPLIM